MCKYACTSNPTYLPYPLQEAAGKVMLCKFCNKASKVFLEPNAAERRYRHQQAATKSIYNKVLKNKVVTEKNEALIICEVCEG